MCDSTKKKQPVGMTTRDYGGNVLRNNSQIPRIIFINSVFDWELEQIFEIIKTVYPKYPAVRIEKKKRF